MKIHWYRRNYCLAVRRRGCGEARLTGIRDESQTSGHSVRNWYILTSMTTVVCVVRLNILDFVVTSASEKLLIVPFTIPEVVWNGYTRRFFNISYSRSEVEIKPSDVPP